VIDNAAIRWTMTTCYWSAIVTTVVSCTVFELFVSFARYSDLFVENAKFLYPTCI